MQLIDAFERFAAGCLARQKSNSEQARTLAALRDRILPKFISGELRVNDAEKLIESAA